MKKKIFNLFLVVLMIIVFNPIIGYAEANYVAQIGTEKYETLTEAIAAVTDTTPTTIKIINDVINENVFVIGKEGSGNVSILKQNITIDLNGYKIIKSDSTGTGSIFTIIGSGTLTIDDSSKEKTGLITSGSSEIMRGFDVARGTFVLKGGTITTSLKDTNWSGGGVNVWKQGEFIMEGGAIKDCKAGKNGGGVNVGTDNTKWSTLTIGTFTMKGGIIKNCSTPSTSGWGGGVSNWTKVIMEDGTIEDNTASNGGGGITTSADATFIMTGGTIKGNTAKGGNIDSSGGGVCGAGILKIGGNAVITDNKWNLVTNNFYLRTANYIELDNPSSDMNVGIVMQNGTGKFTTNGIDANIGAFTPDNSDYVVQYNTSGYLELALGYNIVVSVNDESMGTASANFNKAAIGSKILLTATPKSGYAFVKWDTEDVDDISNGQFEMPNKTVAVKAIFEKSYNYEFLEGNNQKFTIGNIKSYILKIDGDYSLFESLKIGNLDLIKDEDYEVTEGSTIITFTDKGIAKLNALSKGEYEILVKYSNNKEVKGKLNINSNVDNPKTGDNIVLYLILGSISLVSLATCDFYLNHKRFN